ncbi:hypothetical protein PTKIN_Ptkin02bG0048500 [Pterospermum kingtungense]
MESQDFGHEHPLLLMFNEETQSNQSEASPTHRCSRNVPKHPPIFITLSIATTLCLLPTPPAKPKYSEGFVCDFCGKEGELFVYHCSDCDLDLHIKCALFTFNLAENRVGDLKPIACKDNEKLGNAKCFGCCCNLLVHKKCISLPRIIKFMWHEHPFYHTYFLQPHESGYGDCVREDWYYMIETDEEQGDNSTLLSDMNSSLSLREMKREKQQRLNILAMNIT